MVKQSHYPDLFPGISIADAIIDILAKEPRLKARQIAYRLNTRFGLTNVVRKDVNSMLYGRLRDQVKRIADYRWMLRKEKKEVTILYTVPASNMIAPKKEEQSLWGFIKLIFG